jgi:galactose mutarotase-like enzyme
MAFERITIRSGPTEAELIPERGGLLSRLRAGDLNLLYMDETTLNDPTRSVRGGVPILFPCAGPLPDDLFRHMGRSYVLRQHGFARNLPWRVISVSSSEATLVLNSTKVTREAFPFEFRLEFTYTVTEGSVTILQKYRNLSDKAMPLHAGLHPYLVVPQYEKGRVTIATRASRAFDNVTKTEVPFEGFDLSRDEVDLHLYDHGSTAAVLRRRSVAIRIDASPEMSRWVVWTLAGRDFVCVEPWTAGANALNTGKGLLSIPPGGSHELFTKIGLDLA